MRNVQVFTWFQSVFFLNPSFFFAHKAKTKFKLIGSGIVFIVKIEQLTGWLKKITFKQWAVYRSYTLH